MFKTMDTLWAELSAISAIGTGALTHNTQEALMIKIGYF